jgi:hypothetical protein
LQFALLDKATDMPTAADQTAALLNALWQRNRPLVEDRLARLDLAAQAATAGLLGEEQREEAAGTAHKLAGSLGMYGFPHGTKLARQIELLLDYPTPVGAELRGHIAELRQTIFPEA